MPGYLGSLLGIGSGLLAIPALGAVFGPNQQLAQDTALVMVVPSVVLALWCYHQRNRIDPCQARVPAPIGLFCTFLASSIAARIDAARMHEAFVIFLLALADYMFRRLLRCPSRSGVTPRYGLPWMGMLGLGAGSLSGPFGVNGEVLATPVLTSALSLTQVVAQGPTLALVAPNMAVVLETYTMHGHVDWRVGTPLALGGLLNIPRGVRLVHAVPERSLRMAFYAFLALCVVLLLVRD